VKSGQSKSFFRGGIGFRGRGKGGIGFRGRGKGGTTLDLLEFLSDTRLWIVFGFMLELGLDISLISALGRSANGSNLGRGFLALSSSVFCILVSLTLGGGVFKS